MVKTYVGHRIIHLESVDSTNNYVAKLKNEGKISSGAVILSDIQTDGRGQRANKWQSNPFENLTFSFLLEPQFVNNISSITINHCVSLALLDFLATFKINAHIKWPNDIYVDKRKIAGILIENNFKSGSVNYSIIGVGVNINQTIFDELKATSLREITGKAVNVKSVLFEIIFHLNARLYAFTNTSAEIIKGYYDAFLCNMNESVSYLYKSKSTEGIIRGTDELGNILIEQMDEILTFRNGEIKLKMRD